MTEWQNDRQDKNNMPPNLRSGGHKNNKSTANGTKYARQIFKEAMILTFDKWPLKRIGTFFSHHEESLCKVAKSSCLSFSFYTYKVILWPWPFSNYLGSRSWSRSWYFLGSSVTILWKCYSKSWTQWKVMAWTMSTRVPLTVQNTLVKIKNVLFFFFFAGSISHHETEDVLKFFNTFS
jgi:hypothetical protein